MPGSSIAHLLELRVKARGNPEATALIDRCLRLIARARADGRADVAALDREVAEIADELALRYGSPRSVTLQ